MIIENKETEAEVVETETKDTQVERLERQLAIVKEESKENYQKMIRAQAETENIKKRSEKDVDSAHKFALDRFVKALLEVKDSVTMGLRMSKSENTTVESISEGLEMTNSLFLSTMSKFGVDVIDPKGEKFDHEFHEAITVIESGDEESGNVVEVIQHGFTLNGRLVRPAMVIVSS